MNRKLAVKGGQVCRDLAGSDPFLSQLTSKLKHGANGGARLSGRSLGDWIARAGAKLEAIRPKIKEAKTFMAQTRERSDLGEQAMEAELIPARTAVSLFAFLEKVYAEACEGEDRYPLMRVSTAAASLFAALDSKNFFRKGRYTGASDALFMSMKYEDAQNLELTVLQMLDHSDKQLQSLGVSYQSPPSLSVVH